MILNLEQNQVEILQEILQSALKELRVESARADSRDYRTYLHERERAVEGLLGDLNGSESRVRTT